MAESSGKGAGAHPKLNYTPEERSLFGRLFRECDTDGTNVVTGEAAVRMFQRSRISEQVLSEIWAMADVENRGFLLQEDFAKAMRLIGRYQAQPGIALRPELTLSPGPLPKFEGINMSGGAAPAMTAQTTGLTAQHSGPIRVPPLTNDRITEYLRLFDRAGAQNGLLSGDIARTSFELSGLPSEILAAIWNLVDTEQRGSLNVTEFIIAMHLLASYKAKTLTALPPTIPPGLYEAATRRPGPQGLRSPISRPIDANAIPRQMSGQNTGRGPPGRQFSGSNDWAISAREKASYDELFDKVDTLRQGYVSGEQAVLFFSDSGLPADVLASIWDLSNIRRLDQLNRDEFAVAMHLIRNQRGKQVSDLPSELPPNLIPPSLRQSLQAQNTGSQFPGQAPPPPASFPKSNADDLFGLDALTASPPSTAGLQKDITGGSSALNRSTDLDPFASGSPPIAQQKFPTTRGTAQSFFKPFAPTSSFGSALAQQDTGASSASGRSAGKQPLALDDLLGDNEPEESKKLTSDSADLANMSNQIGTLRTQMQNVQQKKSQTENQLAGNADQKRDMEQRLQQFRAQYEQQVSSLKALEDRLAKERGEVAQLSQQISLVQSSYQDVQTRHREAAATLASTKRENSALKDKIRQMNEFISQAQPEIEKMQSELRREKGLVAIQKKQAEKLEDDRSQHEKTRSEFAEFRRQESARPSSRDVHAPSSVTTPGGSTNPFMKRTPQASVDNTASPAGVSRTLSHESNKFDNIFNSTFGGTAANDDHSASFRDAFAQQPGSSVKSSEPGLPTPSTSPPQSSYTQSSHVPAQPISRQITSSDLPLHTRAADNASIATSVQVETPGSHYDASTPTSAFQPKDSQLGQSESSRSATQPTGTSAFERTISASSPVASLKSETSRATNKPNEQEGLFAPGASLQSRPPRSSSIEGRSEVLSGTQNNSAAPFSSLAPSDPRSAGSLKSPGDPVAKFDSKFPPLENELPAEFATAKPKSKDEFPPIAINDEDSGSDTDTQGFDDDFTKASPQQKKDNATLGRGAEQSSQSFANAFNNNEIPPPPPPDAPPGAFDADDFADSFTPVVSNKQSNSPFGPASAGTSGQALFGGSSAGKAPAKNTNSMSSSSMTGTVRSDTFQSATSQQGSADHESSPIDSVPAAAASNVASGSSAFDDFEHGFDDLTDAKEDDRENDDLFFRSSQNDEHDFLPSFDSPLTSATHSNNNQGAGRQAAGENKHVFDPDFNTGEFENAFSSSTFGQSGAASAGRTEFGANKSANTGGSSSWDAMMKRLDGQGPSATDGASSTAPGASASNDFTSHLPEAPEPPKLGRAVSHGTEHDDPILKKLTGMGYPRPVALSALEKFDYDISKATDYLASPR